VDHETIAAVLAAGMSPVVSQPSKVGGAERAEMKIREAAAHSVALFKAVLDALNSEPVSESPERDAA
jgi:hypothetical protein